MAGSFRSRSFIAILAAATISVASCVTSYVVTRWRSTVSWLGSWFDRSVTWFVSRMPKVKADWLDAWHRALAAAAPLMPRTMKRRPLLSTRWRLCSSV